MREFRRGKIERSHFVFIILLAVCGNFSHEQFAARAFINHMADHILYTYEYIKDEQSAIH